jgi:hypothetical protein
MMRTLDVKLEMSEIISCVSFLKHVFKLREVGWHSNANGYDLLTQNHNIHLFICTHVDREVMFCIENSHVKAGWKYANLVHIWNAIS